MNRYMVTWYRKEFPSTEFTDIIDDVNSEQEAVDKVRTIHLNAIVVAVGIMVTNWLQKQDSIGGTKMDKIKYRLIEFEGMLFWQRISDGKLVKRAYYG